MTELGGREARTLEQVTLAEAALAAMRAGLANVRSSLGGVPPVLVALAAPEPGP